jgi:hypothetical protein
MNVIDAAYATVSDYPGGAEALATRMTLDGVKVTGAVLRNRVNPNNPRNRLAIDDASKIMALTGDHQILQALAAEHGYVLVKADEMLPEPVCRSVGQIMLKVSVAEGEFTRAVHDAAADGVITQNEADQLTGDGLAVQRTIIWALQRIRALVGQRGVS